VEKLQDKRPARYFSPIIIIRAITSRKMRWTENLARMEDKRNAHTIWVGEGEGRYHLARM